jgi:hypothetical protein
MVWEESVPVAVTRSAVPKYVQGWATRQCCMTSTLAPTMYTVYIRKIDVLTLSLHLFPCPFPSLAPVRAGCRLPEIAHISVPAQMFSALGCVHAHHYLKVPLTSKNGTFCPQIRINFYSTMLLLAIIPRTPNTEELLNKLYENTGIAGFALLLTAIIQTCHKQISLFEALFTLHILFFLGTGASPMGECSLSILFAWSLRIAAHSRLPR